MQPTPVKIQTVEDYINQFSPDIKKRIEQIQNIVEKLAPTAEKSLSYGMIGYKLNHKPLIYVGGFTKHVGLFPTGSGIASLQGKPEFEKYITSKGTMQFKHSEPLPLKLVEEVVKIRVSEIS